MPQPKRKRRWKLFLLWTFLVFVGGAVAGVALSDDACMAIDRAASMLGVSAPRFVVSRRQEARAPLPSAVEPAPASSPEPAPEPAPAPAAPSAPKGEGVVQALAEKPAAAPAKSKPQVEQLAEPPAAPEPPVARAARGKGAAKTPSSASPSGKKSVKFDDPFAGDSDTSVEAKPAASMGKAKPSSSEPAAAAKSPAKPAAKSNDPLDNLMNDGVADSKGKKRASKDLDDLLKDVQKSQPEPKAKPEAPPPAAALSSSDISRVMAGVKTRSNDCARRLNQKGNAELKITVGKDGRISDVNVGGNVAGTPLGACIEKATRAAVFPASSGLKFDYRIDAR